PRSAATRSSFDSELICRSKWRIGGSAGGGDLVTEDNKTKKPQWAMVIDLDRCTGCEACVVACRVENNIPTVGPEEAAKGRSMNWIRVERYFEGEYPDVKVKFMPVLCQHC